MTQKCAQEDCEVIIAELGWRTVTLGGKYFCCKGCGTAWLWSQGMRLINSEKPKLIVEHVKRHS